MSRLLQAGPRPARPPPPQSSPTPPPQMLSSSKCAAGAHVVHVMCGVRMHAIPWPGRAPTPARAPPCQVRRLFSRCYVVGRAFPICHVHHDGTLVEVSSFHTNADASRIPPDAAALTAGRHKALAKVGPCASCLLLRGCNHPLGPLQRLSWGQRPLLNEGEQGPLCQQAMPLFSSCPSCWRLIGGRKGPGGAHLERCAARQRPAEGLHLQWPALRALQARAIVFKCWHALAQLPSDVFLCPGVARWHGVVHTLGGPAVHAPCYGAPPARRHPARQHQAAHRPALPTPPLQPHHLRLRGGCAGLPAARATHHWRPRRLLPPGPRAHPAGGAPGGTGRCEREQGFGWWSLVPLANAGRLGRGALLCRARRWRVGALCAGPRLLCWRRLQAWI